jgi:hypothetical protein
MLTKCDFNGYMMAMTHISNPIAPIRCNDGFSMSVQASSMHYCHPRSDQGPWSSFEVWGSDNALLPYVEKNSEVCGFVPLDVVVTIINNHGGMAK